MTKFKLVIEYLNTLNDNEIFCFVDAYDVIMNRNIDELYQKFIEFKKINNYKIICANNPKITLNVNNIQYYLTKLDFESNGEITINPGTYIGYVKDVKSILEEIYNLKKNNDTDDQLFLNRYHLNNPNIIFDKEWFDVFMEILDLSHYNKNSFFIHRPGCGLFFNYLKTNNYIITKKEIINILLTSIIEFLKKTKYHIIHLLKNLINHIFNYFINKNMFYH